MKKILFIIGSLRKGSFNRQVAKIVEKYLEGKAEVSYLDFADIPPLNQDLEYPAPPSVTAARKAVGDADAIWIFSPEYNFSYPGLVKNLIDWLSRPVDPQNREAPTVLVGKKVTLTGAGGKEGTGKCRQKLTELLKLLQAIVMIGDQTGIVLNIEAWTEDKMILTEKQEKHLRIQADEFLKFIGG